MKKATLLLTVFACTSFLIPAGKAHTGIITTVAGNGTAAHTGDGAAATAASISAPWSVSVDGAGNIYIGDLGNHVVRKVSTSGIITTIAGNGTPSYVGDGGPATASGLNFPSGVGFDTAGNIYISDLAQARIRKVDPSGIITTAVGNTLGGYTGDGGPATNAGLCHAGNVVFDKTGNLYFSDGCNNVIRKVNTAGIISTIAGTSVAGYFGDGGPATAAQLNQPLGIKMDRFGNLFFADEVNNVIRKINTSGIISTVAGTGTPGYTGDLGPATAAEINEPDYVDVDVSGNIFIADNFNGVIRKVDPSGIITTIAGIAGAGHSGYNGDGIAATTAELNGPTGIMLDNVGNLYIADYANNRIRKINSVGAEVASLGVLQMVAPDNHVVVFPNPNKGSFTVIASLGSANDEQVQLTITDMLGRVVYKDNAVVQNGNIRAQIRLDQGLHDGLYLLCIKSETDMVISRFEVE